MLCYAKTLVQFNANATRVNPANYADATTNPSLKQDAVAETDLAMLAGYAIKTVYMQLFFFPSLFHVSEPFQYHSSRGPNINSNIARQR